MKILMILSDSFFPDDIRVKKEVRTLLNNGHEVSVITLRRKGQLRSENVDGVTVFRYRCPFQLHLALHRHLVFFHILHITRKMNIDAFHVHDMPCALASCLAGVVCQKPVVVDLHEDYTDMIMFSVKGFRGLKRAEGILLSKILSFEEWICLRSARKVIVVVEESIERLVKMGIPKQKIVVIHNTSDLEELKNATDDKVKTEEIFGKFTITYVGHFSRYRGLDTLLKAMPLICEKIPNAHLLLVGDGETKGELVRLCNNLNIDKNVTFTGWVSFEEAMNYIKMSDVCAIPYHRTRQTNRSFPHKLGQYMFFGKPILVSDVDSLKRIVYETKCGIVYEASNSRALAEKLVEATEQMVLKEMGVNAKITAETELNWTKTSERLCGLYEELESSRRNLRFTEKSLEL